MNLEQIVTSKSVSQQLADAGIKNKTIFYWVVEGNNAWEVKHYDDLQGVIGDGWTWFEEATNLGDCIPAYTATELFELLTDIRVFKYEGKYIVHFTVKNKSHPHICSSIHKEESKHLPDALGRMTLYLSKEGLLK